MPFDIADELRSIAIALNESQIDYAVCGGLALAIHGCPRATEDIDILIREEDLDRISSLLRAKGFTVSAGPIPLGAGKENKLSIHRVMKLGADDSLTVDLVLVPHFMEEIWRDREIVQAGDYDLSVVSLDGLKQMKRMSGRLHDLADIGRLEELEPDDGD
ncbi:MAG: nucleotidyltransferase family protein [Candidatus Coatesbacteria bacterium]|nr:nucleotidyltransferase family protein [Candidatus Coatesbacteria bacterium]